MGRRSTWQKIQDRFDGNAHAPARKNVNFDFPLRGFVCCAAYGNAMTAAWSKGRNELYPYYHCQSRHCHMKGKSIRRDKIEGDFEALLQQMTPPPRLFELVKILIIKRWGEQEGVMRSAAEEARAEITTLQTKIDKLVERIVEASAPAVIEAYEKQIAILDKRRLLLKETTLNTKQSDSRFEDSYRTACTILSNPWKLWTSGRYELQRLVLRLLFSDRINYCKNTGYRTTSIAEPLRLLGSFSTPVEGMVGPAGLEPATKPL